MDKLDISEAREEGNGNASAESGGSVGVVGVSSEGRLVEREGESGGKGSGFRNLRLRVVVFEMGRDESLGNSAGDGIF